MGNSGGARRTAAALLPAGVVVGLLVLVWAATTGPVRLLGTARPSTTGPAALPSDEATATPSPPGMPSAKQIFAGEHSVADLSWLGELIGYSLVLAACLALFVLVRSLWRNRWRAPARPEEVAFEVLPGPELARALEDDADAQAGAVDLGGARDGIVACWLRLEETIAASGVRSRPAETSTELVSRVLQALDVDPRAIASLAGLYREARFSEHPMSEASRDQARAALRVLQTDLAQSRAAT